MAASDYVPIFFKNRLHLLGRPQMGSRPSRHEIEHRTIPFHYSIPDLWRVAEFLIPVAW
jgi:hypothetical protein